MAIREIAKSYEYKCDGCGEIHLQENANGHYTNSTPPGWGRLNFIHRSIKSSLPSEVLLCELCCVKLNESLSLILKVEP